MTDPRESTRREFLGAAVVAIGSALLVGILWLIARRAPSATRDPEMTPPALVPTRPPPPVSIPSPTATVVFTPLS
ncbi:MAG: hypothetical protein KY456_00690 [Chloroflexi bacterium]|nr:hypothetical protein [Chloroflexota bacterium]